MNDLREAVAIAMKKEREKVLAQPLARIWPDLAGAAFRAIEEAGFVVVKKSNPPTYTHDPLVGWMIDDVTAFNLEKPRG